MNKNISEKVRIVLYPLGGVLLGLAGLDPEQTEFWLGVLTEVLALAWLIIERTGALGKSGKALCWFGGLFLMCFSLIGCEHLRRTSGKVCYVDPERGTICVFSDGNILSVEAETNGISVGYDYKIKPTK